MGTMLGFMYRQRTFKPQPLPANVRLDGRVALVTGANVGLGFEVARELAHHGASKLVLGVRDTSKGEAAQKKIQEQIPNCSIEVWPLDHDSFPSVSAFASRAQALDRLDIAILNAGVKLLDCRLSPSGHESNVQINHLGTALLSLLLLAPLQKTFRDTENPSRMTIVTSEMHFFAKFREATAPNILARMDQKESFGSGMERYSSSKLLNVLWTRELSSKVQDVIINNVNPGLCASSLHRSDTTPGAATFNKIFAWTPEQGGHCLADAAIQHPDSHGEYLSEQTKKPPSKFVLSAQGKKTQEKIWIETLEILKAECADIELPQLSV